MAEAVRIFTWKGDDQLSAVAKGAAVAVGSVDASASKAATSVRALGQSARVTWTEVQNGIALAKLATAAQGEWNAKLTDAAKKMGEFQASNAQIAQGFRQSTELSTKYGVSIGRSAELLEELAIQTQRPTEALRLQEKAMRLMIATNSRADDAAEAVAKTLRGETEALRLLGAAGARTAAQIDKIADPQLRAKKAQEALNQQLDKGANIIDKVGAQAQALRVDINSLFGGFDVAGGAATALAGAVAAIGAAAVATAAKVAQYTAEATTAFLEVSPHAQLEIKELDRSLQSLQLATGEVIAGHQDMADQIQEAATVVSFATTKVRELHGALSFLPGTLDTVKGALALTAIAVDAASGQMGVMTTHVRLLNAELDKHAEAEKARIARRREDVKVENEGNLEGRKNVEALRMRAQAAIDAGKDVSEADRKRLELMGQFFTKELDTLKKIREKVAKEDEREEARKNQIAIAATRRAEKEQADLDRFAERMLAGLEKSQAKEAAILEKGLAKRMEIEGKLRQSMAQTAKLQADVGRVGAVVGAGFKPGEAGLSAVEAAEGDLEKSEQILARMEETGESAEQAAVALRVGVGKNVNELERGLMGLGVKSIQTAKLVGAGIQSVAQAIGQGMANMTADLVAGTFTLKQFAANVSDTLGQLLTQAGSGLLAMGVATLNPGLIAAAGAMMVAGGALRGLGTRMSGSASAGGGSSMAVERSDFRQEARQERLERKFPDERDRQRYEKEQRREEMLEQARAEDLRNRTFLEAVQLTLSEDRARNRETLQLFQVFAGAVRGQGGSDLDRDIQTRQSISRLQRSGSLITPGGAPVGLMRR